MKHNMREEIKRAGVRESALSRYAFRLLWSLFRTVLLVAMSFVILYPLLYMISMAIRQPSDVYDPTVVWVPRHFTLENFRNAAEAMKYGQALMNTLQIAIFSSVIQMLVCSFVAYGFARFRFPLKKLFILCLFLMVVIPTQTISLPTYTLFRNLDFLGILQGVSGGKAALSILDTPFVFYLPAVFGAGLRSGIFILIFMQFFRNMPKDLEDAAYIDGCGFFKTYVRIMLPNLRNAMLIVFLFLCMVLQRLLSDNDFCSEHADAFHHAGQYAAKPDSNHGYELGHLPDYHHAAGGCTAYGRAFAACLYGAAAFLCRKRGAQRDCGLMGRIWK